MQIKSLGSVSKETIIMLKIGVVFIKNCAFIEFSGFLWRKEREKYLCK